MSQRTKNYKPSSADLARATRELWSYVDDARVLAELREVNGVTLQPGEFTQRELLSFLYGVVDAWHEGNYGNCGARKFLANLVRRGLVSVVQAETAGKPSKYTIATDPATGEPWDEEAFQRSAYEHRRAAYTAPASGLADTVTTQHVPASEYADIMRDL